MNPKPLTDRQRAFAFEYLKDLNGTQAALRAGYTEKSARSTAVRLLNDERLQEVICEARARVESEAIMSYEEACRTLTAIGRGECADTTDGPMGKVETLRQTSRIRAIEALSKLKGYEAPQEKKVIEYTIELPPGMMEAEEGDDDFDDGLTPQERSDRWRKKHDQEYLETCARIESEMRQERKEMQRKRNTKPAREPDAWERQLMASRDAKGKQ